MTGLQNSRNPALADFEWRGFAQTVRQAVAKDGRALAPLAVEMGITTTDLSRVQGGSMVSIAKVLAICLWLKQDVSFWYLAPLPDPMKTRRCSGANVKQSTSEVPA